jgi:hypothetical protein
MGEGLGSAKNVGEHVESGDGALIGQVLSVTLRNPRPFGAGPHRLRSQNTAPISLMNWHQNATQNHTLARGSLVNIEKYTVALP